MSLSDPRPAPAEHSSLVDYLSGVVALARIVDELALDSSHETHSTADDFVYLLLGVASMGAAIEGLVDRPAGSQHRPATTPQRWLR